MAVYLSRTETQYNAQLGNLWEMSVRRQRQYSTLSKYNLRR